MKRVVIIGASSGIGRELAKLYAREGCLLGLAARRLSLLEQLSRELGGQAVIAQMDISAPEQAAAALGELAPVGRYGAAHPLFRHGSHQPLA